MPSDEPNQLIFLSYLKLLIRKLVTSGLVVLGLATGCQPTVSFKHCDIAYIIQPSHKLPTGEFAHDTLQVLVPKHCGVGKGDHIKRRSEVNDGDVYYLGVGFDYPIPGDQPFSLSQVVSFNEKPPKPKPKKNMGA